MRYRAKFSIFRKNINVQFLFKFLLRTKDFWGVKMVTWINNLEVDFLQNFLNFLMIGYQNLDTRSFLQVIAPKVQPPGYLGDTLKHHNSQKLKKDYFTSIGVKRIKISLKLTKSRCHKRMEIVTLNSKATIANSA